MIRVGIFGGSGYTGRELLYILSKHDKIDLVFVASSGFANQKIKDVFPFLRWDMVFLDYDSALKIKDVDVVFLATPDRVSMEYGYLYWKAGVKVIDLSGAYRLKDADIFFKYYGFEHKYAELLDKAVYGLPELYKEEIEVADLVANPGCYAIASILPLYPLLLEYEIDSDFGVIIDAKSGLSGRGGRKDKDSTPFYEYNENFSLYSPFFHRHTPEIKEKLIDKTKKDFYLLFTPHLVPMDRGILLTIYLRLKKEVIADEIKAVYKRYYADYPQNIVLDDDFPKTKYCYMNNMFFINVYTRGKEVIISSAIDNLWRGASSTAIMNMNLMFSLPLYTGL
jgi:N-acetyl-gamma-glutamyl-phosphate reductase